MMTFLLTSEELHSNTNDNTRALFSFFRLSQWPCREYKERLPKTREFGSQRQHCHAETKRDYFLFENNNSLTPLGLACFCSVLRSRHTSGASASTWCLPPDQRASWRKQEPPAHSLPLKGLLFPSQKAIPASVQLPLVEDGPLLQTRIQ